MKEISDLELKNIQINELLFLDDLCNWDNDLEVMMPREDYNKLLE